MPLYITTPIYYVNDTPHIGHAYTTIVADVLARYHRLFGDEVLFLTGTDEHGLKVQQAAKARNLDPQKHCDEMMIAYEAIWKELNCAYDIFMRTTKPFHISGVQSALQFLFEKGDIYTKSYDGWYSVSEEIFYTEKDLIDGKSPQGKEVTKVSEQNYFFRMSKYQDALLAYLEKNPLFIRPEHKRSEVLGFLKQPLEDLCISRPKERLSWGIEIPFDKKFVTYVWFDALLNYATAIGFNGPHHITEEYRKFWPHVVHLMGKDILITHSIYWTTMLMALEQPLPKTIFAHGWWLTGDQKKMSKSEGPVVKPLDIKQEIGVDALRYFLCREVVLGNDAQFSRELIVARLNSELANNLGNLLSRSIALIEKYFSAKIPDTVELSDESKLLLRKTSETKPLVEKAARNLMLHAAVGEVITLLTEANRFLDSRAPWKAAKEDLPHAAETLSVVSQVLVQAGVLLSPVMPAKCEALLERLGFALKNGNAEKIRQNVTIGEPLFPRVI